MTPPRDVETDEARIAYYEELRVAHYLMREALHTLERMVAELALCTAQTPARRTHDARASDDDSPGV